MKHSFKGFCQKGVKLVTPIKIDYKDIMDDSKNLTKEIKNTFSLEGPGMIVVKNIPNYLNYREKVLKSGYILANESEEVRNSISKPHVDNAIGYDNIPFITKGDKVNKMFTSFTARNLRNTLVYPQNQQMEKDHENIWPKCESLKDFKENFVSLGKIVNSCQAGVFKRISRYITQIDPKFNNRLEKDLGEEQNHDSYGRLITYFPPENYFHEMKDEDDKYIWDDWHTDYSLLTALAMPIYFDKNGKVFPNKFASLQIKNRIGEKIEVQYEESELAMFCSDTMFILSGGHILPTPHTVRINPRMPLNLFRVNIATFFQPNYNFKMYTPHGESFDEVIEKDPLKFEFKNGAFKNGMNYGEYFELSLNYLLNRK